MAGESPWDTGGSTIFNLRGIITVVMADLLFILFASSCFAYVELAAALYFWSNPNHSNKRSVMQWFLTLWWVLSVFCYKLKTVWWRPTVGWGKSLSISFTIQLLVGFTCKNGFFKKGFLPGSCHSSVVLSAPTILQPWVPIPSTPSMLFSICMIEKLIRKGQK